MRNSLKISFLILLPFSHVPATEVKTPEQAEINQLAKQLTDYKLRRQAYAKLEQMAATNQAALIPILQLFTDTQADNGGTYETLRKANTFLRKYFITQPASAETISVMIEVVEQCARNKNRWYGPISKLLRQASSGHILSEEQIARLYAVAELYMEKVRKRQTSAYHATEIMEVVAQQGKYRSLAPEILSLAREFLDSKNHQARIVGMELFASQLYLNDSESRKIIYRLITSDEDKSVRYKTITALTGWLEIAKSPDKDSRFLLSLYESKKYDSIRNYLRQSLAKIVKNPQLENALKAELYTHITGIADADRDYLALERNLKTVAIKALTDNEIKELLHIIARHGEGELGNKALDLFLQHKRHYGLTQYAHHELMFVALKNSSLLKVKPFYELVKHSAPYSYLSDTAIPDYPQEVVLNLIAEMKMSDKVQVWNLGLHLLDQIKTRQDMTAEVIDSLYLAFENTENEWLRSRLAHHYLYAYYKKTGYLDFETLARYVERGKVGNIHLLNTVYLAEIAQGRAGEPTEKLFGYYKNTDLPDPFRLGAVQQLAVLDFDYAQKHILPVYAVENDMFVVGVWQRFKLVAEQYQKKVDKPLLLDATRHHNEHVRYIAWVMLEDHGVSTPFRVKWSRKSYRQDVYSGLIFFVGGPVSLLIGSLLFLKRRKGTKVRYVWTRYAGILLWLGTTLAGFVFGAGLLFLAGLSHSGTPHRELNYGFSIIFGGYVLIALIVRLLTPTVHIEEKITEGE